MVSSESPRIKELRSEGDPLARAKAAQALIIYAREIEAQAQKIRDEAIREAHAAGKATVDGITAHIGCKRNVVVDALRDRKKT